MGVGLVIIYPQSIDVVKEMKLSIKLDNTLKPMVARVNVDACYKS